jgi:hypothetical protein
MKKLILAVSLLVMSAAAHAAGWWSLDGDVSITNTQVTFSARNNTGRAVYCRGYVYGRTQFGEVANFFVDGWVQNGQWVRGYVNTTGNRYLVAGWADISCRF